MLIICMLSNKISFPERRQRRRPRPGQWDRPDDEVRGFERTIPMSTHNEFDVVVVGGGSAGVAAAAAAAPGRAPTALIAHAGCLRRAATIPQRIPSHLPLHPSH